MLFLPTIYNSYVSPPTVIHWYLPRPSSTENSVEYWEAFPPPRRPTTLTQGWRIARIFALALTGDDRPGTSYVYRSLIPEISGPLAGIQDPLPVSEPIMTGNSIKSIFNSSSGVLGDSHHGPHCVEFD